MKTVALLLVVGCVGCGTSPEFVDDPADPSEAEAYTAPVSAEGSSSLLGRWSGVGYQSSGSSWDMVLDVARTDEGPCAVVRYPDVGCAGYWNCNKGSNDGYLDAVERITSGKGKCIDRVKVQARLTPSGRVAFEAQADEQTAEATLAPAQ